MRKPNQPNTLGFYGHKKSTHGESTAKKIHTASARNKALTMPAAKFSKAGKTSKQPSLKGFIYQNKHIRLGLCLMLERTAYNV